MSCGGFHCNTDQHTQMPVPTVLSQRLSVFQLQTLPFRLNGGISYLGFKKPSSHLKYHEFSETNKKTIKPQQIKPNEPKPSILFCQSFSSLETAFALLHTKTLYSCLELVCWFDHSSKVCLFSHFSLRLAWAKAGFGYFSPIRWVLWTGLFV